MEQSMWGVTSQPLLRSDRIWREIRQDDRVHEVFATSSTRCSTQEEIISVVSSTRLSKPYSGNDNYLWASWFQSADLLKVGRDCLRISAAYFRSLANKFIPLSSCRNQVNDISDETVFIEQLNVQ